MRRLLSLLPLLVLFLFPRPGLSVEAAATVVASEDPAWMTRLGMLPIQDSGRVMPLDSFARSLAGQLTGRERWRAGAGPEAFAGRQPIELLCDLLFKPEDVVHRPLITVENRPFKTKVGLDPSRRFFSATELVSCQGIESVLQEYAAAKEADSNKTADRMQKIALDLQGSIERLSSISNNALLPIVSAGDGKPYRSVGLAGSAPGLENVQAALRGLQQSYLNNRAIGQAVDSLIVAVNAAGVPDSSASRTVPLEHFYNDHHPWRMAAYAYGLSIVFFGLASLAMRRVFMTAAVVTALLGVAEHITGVVLRVMILGRAPVSNTYEAILWMGLVGIAIGLVGQIINRRAWYLFAGIGIALLSVIFSTLVPLETRTNALPAVLRSNYWLIVHVLTIVASYGVLAVASLLGHVYLVKEVIFRRSTTAAAAPRGLLSHPLIVQTYRAIQIGLFLLTAGTILGGVWAADSWGRFWGWDPKETWALISIVIYFAVLHARYVRWIKDFGLASAAVLSFASIVWTFYGVNYLMASGLHSYGFGSGGGGWVAAWLVAEIIFVAICRWRYLATRRQVAPNRSAQTASQPATAQEPQSTLPPAASGGLGQPA